MILNRKRTWPPAVVDYLEKVREILPQVVADQFSDSPILLELRSLLDPHDLVGYHCSRLTEDESKRILTHGMVLPNREFAKVRIQALVNSGLIDSALAAQFIGNNDTDDPYRVGRLWFFFLPPHRASIGGQWATERLFRSWGGEAVYQQHEREQSGVALRGIGVPCIVEANVPIRGLHGRRVHDVARFFARHFLAGNGHPKEFTDYSTENLPSTAIRRVIRFQDPAFQELTEFQHWHPPLT